MNQKEWRELQSKYPAFKIKKLNNILWSENRPEMIAKVIVGYDAMTREFIYADIKLLYMDFQKMLLKKWDWLLKNNMKPKLYKAYKERD